ncbi:MAG: hypothetical protein WDA20_13250, partial [Desulfuromonadales bacterium]
FNILLHIAAGVVGNYLYYQHVRAKIADLKAAQPPDMALALREIGGVHNWAIPGLLFFLLMTLLIGGLIVGITSAACNIS